MGIPAILQGNVAVSSRDDGNSKGINESVQVKAEDKKAKFRREQQK